MLGDNISLCSCLRFLNGYFIFLKTVLIFMDRIVFRFFPFLGDGSRCSLSLHSGLCCSQGFCFQLHPFIDFVE